MKKTVFFAALLFVLASSLVSCLSGEGGNKITLSTYGVITSNEEVGGPSILLTAVSGEEIAVPALEDNSKVQPGDYVWVYMEIDYDHQPSSKYLTAMVLDFKKTDKALVENKLDDEYNYPLTQLEMYEYNSNLNGNVFLIPGYQAPDLITQPLGLEFKVVIQRDDEQAAKGEVDAFVVAKQTKSTTPSATTYLTKSVVGTNLYDAIQLFGKDTTVTSANPSYVTRILHLNLYYSGLDKDSVPEYKPAGKILVNTGYYPQ